MMNLALLLVVALQAPAPAEDPVGTWSGTLDVRGQKLKIVLRIKKAKDGGLKGTVDVPAQGAYGLILDSCTHADSTLRFEFKAAGFRFEGKRAKEGDAFEGTFHQAGISLPLTLKRGGAGDEPKRPQTPKPPFPYEVHEVSVPSAPGVTLAGTLTAPKGKGPHPAVVLVTGSGPQDRDETLFLHKPFLVLADHLTRKGIAVLRFDDRGAGKSTGSFMKATTEDFAADAAACVAWLRKRPEIDPARIGVAGHSEGGLVAPMVAARDARLGFIVLLAGTGVRGDRLLIRQAEVISRASGIPDGIIRTNRELQEKIFKAVRESPDDDAAAERIREILKGLMSKPQVEQQVMMSASPWMRFFVDHEPSTVLAKVSCPVLALNGERDLQVDPKQNLPAIGKALKEAGNEDVTVRELEGLNHLFQHCTTGLITEYGTIEETFSPDALTLISDWIVKRTGK